VEHNKNLLNDAEEFYNTGVNLDIEGNLCSVSDARNNMVMRYQYDMLGNKVFQNSMDSGQRWLLVNILGKPLRTWDDRNFEFQYFYDILHRPTQSKVAGGDGDTSLDHIFDRVFYGELVSNPKSKNLRGQVFKHYDTGGLVESPEYDFKGQPLSTTRTLFRNYKSIVNWKDANLDSDLEMDTFTFITETDALGRVSQQRTPDDSILTPSYNESGLLNSESVTHADPAITRTYIKNIDYNEKGQRKKIVYGNDVITKFYYDKETFRLRRLETKRQNSDPLQDWRYTLDPVGNITHIEDKNIPVIFFDNQKITGESTYTYDALYRLVEATGRENNSPLSFNSKDNWNNGAFRHYLNPGDPMSVRNYTQSYQYDGVGNILQMKHQASGNSWTRNYNYQATNNRLISTQIGAETYTCQHHAQHGFITAMPHLEDVAWNFKEELVKTIRQRRTDGGTPETTYYQYDGEGQRIRKITENQAEAGHTPTKKEERIYLAGYERYKKHSGTHAGLQRDSLSLMDEGHRFVMIETRNEVDDGTEKQLVRYQMHNYLGSCCLELDHLAQVISYEEYHPFGTTAFQAKNATIKSAAKRYRFTGMERDEESGLAYHSARYYLPWLGRWLSADPAGLVDGVNRYMYVRNNPVNLQDPTGNNSKRDGKQEKQIRKLWEQRHAKWRKKTEQDYKRLGISTVDEAKEYHQDQISKNLKKIKTHAEHIKKSVSLWEKLHKEGYQYKMAKKKDLPVSATAEVKPAVTINIVVRQELIDNEDFQTRITDKLQEKLDVLNLTVNFSTTADESAVNVFVIDQETESEIRTRLTELNAQFSSTGRLTKSIIKGFHKRSHGYMADAGTSRYIAISDRTGLTQWSNRTNYIAMAMQIIHEIGHFAKLDHVKINPAFSTAIDIMNERQASGIEFIDFSKKQKEAIKAFFKDWVPEQKE